ncbi:response regulator [Parabacteroides sp. FAFU027]|uniref:response regulator n=1 Tax=Parabacteroides sp. FAFU027 TaxID=2922715 RepID=UPI001FAF6E4E|nr:response regulator transcription factor [Parabacteroides sp. FAFU027]
MEENKGKYKVLIVDDEPPIRRMLTITLEAHDYKAYLAEDAKSAMLAATMYNPDVILLDLGLPDKSGLQVLKQLREWSKTPIIVLTVMDDEMTKIAALDQGADDYVTKPFNTGELLARIRVALRHSRKEEESPLFVSGRLSVDLVARVVMLDNAEVKLTATEYAILALFVKHAGRVLTHSFIMKEIWGNPYSDNAQILRVHVAQLRKKIETNPAMPELLITESGVGYRFKKI